MTGSSLYEPLDNGVTVIYGSMYGNTELMAETAAEALAEAGIREIDVHNASVSDLSFYVKRYFQTPRSGDCRSDIFRYPFPACAQRDGGYCHSRSEKPGCASDRFLHMGQKAVGAMNSYIESIGAVSAAEPIAFKQAATAVQLQQCRDAAGALAAKLLQ